MEQVTTTVAMCDEHRALSVVCVCMGVYVGVCVCVYVSVGVCMCVCTCVCCCYPSMSSHSPIVLMGDTTEQVT